MKSGETKRMEEGRRKNRERYIKWKIRKGCGGNVKVEERRT